MKSRGRARNKSPSGPAGLPGQLTHQGTGPSAGADRDGPVRRRPRVDQTPLTLLGLALAALLGLAWLTGLAYLVVRGGLPAPVRLPVVDLVHVYVGIGVVGLLVAKARKVGWRLSVPGEPDMAPRRRWLSWSLVALYGAVGVTGALALVPLPGGASAALVDGHLIAAVWATAPTTVHLLGYRRRAGAMLRRRSRARARRLALGLAVAVVPLVAVAALPGLGRAASPLARQGGAGSWAPDGPQTFVERLALSPPAPRSSGAPGAPADRTLVAGGAGLFLAPVTGAGPGRAGHLHWTRVGPFDDHNLVLGMDLPRRGPVAAWVGTVNGLWLAPRLGGPYRRVASFPSRTVHAIAVGPTDPAVVWASSAAGFLRSTDGGRHWRAENAGVASPATAWALAFLDGRLYGSAGNAVYRWSGSGWAPTSPQYGVVMLDPTPGGRLFASSMGDGIRMLAGGRWQPADGGLLVHDQGAINGIHVVSVTARPGQPAYAGTMADGVAVSLDGGRSWSRTWSGLAGRGVVWRVVPVGRTLVAATDSGVLAYTLPARPAPSALWWLAVAGSALLAAGTAALVLSGSTRPAGPSPSPGGRAGPGADSTAGA